MIRKRPEASIIRILPRNANMITTTRTERMSFKHTGRSILKDHSEISEPRIVQYEKILHRSENLEYAKPSPSRNTVHRYRKGTLGRV